MTGNFQNISAGLTEVIKDYCNEQLGVQPEKILVDLHNQSITVTLEGVTHPAEKNIVQEGMSRGRIEKMYNELFKVSKHIIHSRLEIFLSRLIDRSFFAMESEFGNIVMVFFISGPSS